MEPAISDTFRIKGISRCKKKHEVYFRVKSSLKFRAVAEAFENRFHITDGLTDMGCEYYFKGKKIKDMELSVSEIGFIDNSEFVAKLEPIYHREVAQKLADDEPVTLAILTSLEHDECLTATIRAANILECIKPFLSEIPSHLVVDYELSI